MPTAASWLFVAQRNAESSNQKWYRGVIYGGLIVLWNATQYCTLWIMQFITIVNFCILMVLNSRGYYYNFTKNVVLLCFRHRCNLFSFFLSLFKFDNGKNLKAGVENKKNTWWEEQMDILCAFSPSIYLF